MTLTAGGESHELDARPSDALNLAARMGAPVFVDQKVMDDHGVGSLEGMEHGCSRRPKLNCATLAMRLRDCPPSRLVGRVSGSRCWNGCGPPPHRSRTSTSLNQANVARLKGGGDPRPRDFSFSTN